MANILLITPVPTHPLSGGNHVRVFALATELQRQGHRLTILHASWCPGSRRQMQRHWRTSYVRAGYRWPRRLWPAIALSRATQVLGLSAVHHWTRRWWLKNRPLDLWYDPSLDRWIERLCAREHFDVVWVEYVIWSRAFERFGPNTLKILDTHDIFTDRYKLPLTTNTTPRFWPWGSVSLSAEEESRGLDRADIVIAIQEEEAGRLRAMTKRPVVTIGHALSISDPPDETQVGSNILFVGSAWVPNVDGIRQFAENVFPKVRQRVPAATLQVVGSVGSHVPKTDRCVCLGRVDDLAPVYRNAAVVINPVREGTGLAIKSVEALAWGRPLVTYASGARGFGEAVGAAVRVVDSEEDFAAEVCRLLSDVNERASRAQAAHTFAVAWNERITLQLEATLTQHVAHAGLSRQTV